MTPRQCAVEFRRYAQYLPVRLRNAEKETLKFGKSVAIILSSGPVKQSTLVRMGHPYATRNPRPPIPAWIINAQSNDGLRAKWDTQLGTWTGGCLISTISNRAPYMEFLLHGTTKMIQRPIDQQILFLITPYRLARIEEALASK